MSSIREFSARSLAVNRGGRPVFKDLEYTLSAGQLLKLVGPNGSGKSTLLKTLAGLIHFREGNIIIDGRSLADEGHISECIAYLGHKNALKREFSVLENIDFWAQLWGRPDKVGQSLEDMGIAYLKDTPVRYLSSGQMRRAAIARTICHRATIWLFDEPTVGLDDQGLELLSKTMQRHLQAGGMIICATHVPIDVPDHLTQILNMADFSVPLSALEEQWL